MTITAQALDLAATAAVDPAALGQPGIPVPDDTTAVPMFVAHRLDDTLRGLAHATERIRAAQGAAGDLRAYHCAHLTRHLAQTLDNLHGLTACINEHFPAEAAELEQVRRDVGLAKSLSPQAKVATTAHLLETTLHETAHAERHAAVMGGTGGPDGLWAFNAEHCAKHLAGAVEHAKKLAQQFTDNYPPVARWLTELGTIASPSPGDDGGGRQHARYSGTAAAQLAGPVTVSGQVLELAASEAAAHAAAAQRLTWAEGEIEFGDGIGLAGGWKDAWRHELRGAHGEWVVLGATGHPVRDKGMAVVHPSYGVGEVTSISGARTLPKLPKEDPFLGPQFSPGWNAGARANGGQAVAHVTFADGEKKSFKYVDNADKLYAAVSPKPGAGLAHGADMTIPPAVQDTGGLYYAPHVPTTNGSLDDLSAAEKGSIYHYVSPRDNGVISAFLRKGGGGRVGAAAGEIEAKGTIAEIDSAEQKITLAEDTTVYRGIALTPALKKQIKPGATFTDKDYTSTSLSQDWADTFASLRSKGHAEGIGAHVKPVGGTPLRMALHLQAGQHLVPGEGDIGEYILPRGSSFHVNSVSGGQADITVTSPPVPAALAGSITEQLIELRGWEGWRDEPRDTHGQWTRGAAGVLEKVTEPIRGEGARGNSRPVSEDEFHQMAAEGRGRLNDIQHQPWTTEGIRKNWDAIKARTYAEVQNSWGGATIDPRSGRDLPQGADKYAMSIKPTGLDTTSIPEHASRAAFDEAMNIALAKYGKQLGKGGSYLGVFHDDDLNRIDIDPVTVLDSLREVETIGAYTHAIGGAYHFASGDGFWPPHVPENAAAAMSNVGSGHHFRGPGHWHSQAVAVQQPHNEPEDTQPDDEDTEPPPDGIAAQATDLAWSAATRARAHAKAHATAAATARAHERRDARGRFAKGNDLLGSPLDDARMLGRSPGQRPIGNVTRANAERQRLAAQGHGPETIQQQMMREAGELNTLGSQLRAAGYVPPPVPPPPPSPGAQFVARHLRAQGHGPETIREKLRSRALRKAAQSPSPAAAAAEVERVRAEGKAALRARQHAARRAAGDTWTVDEHGNIVPRYAPWDEPEAPSGDVVAPGVKQLTFPGMPHPPAHAATITEVTRRLDSAIAADHASLKQPGEDAQVDVPSYEGNYFGNSADTKIITFADGSKWVRKRGLPQDEMNAEVAYGLVSGVFGSGSPQPVIRRDSDGETAEWQPALDNAVTAIEWAGQDPEWEDYDPDTATGDPEEMYNSAAGRLIGIVDTVTSAGDRHMGNWMVTTDPDGTKRPIAIDNGRAMFQGGSSSPFAGYLDPGELADEYPTAQWDQWQRGLEAIVPELDDMDIDTPGMMQAFDDLRLEVGA